MAYHETRVRFHVCASALVCPCVCADFALSFKSYDMCTFKLWRLLHTLLMRLTLDSGRFVAPYAGPAKPAKARPDQHWSSCTCCRRSLGQSPPPGGHACERGPCHGGLFLVFASPTVVQAHTHAFASTDRQSVKHQAVENGLEACNIAKAREYDIILMDCNMPIMDGWQV